MEPEPPSTGQKGALTPRETSKGLVAPDRGMRRKRRSHCAEMIRQRPQPSEILPEVGSAEDQLRRALALQKQRQEDLDTESAPPTPSHSDLRQKTRHLKERRTQQLLGGVEGSGLPQYIRGRVTTTVDGMKLAMNAEGASLKFAQESAVQEQLTRLDQLRRAYNTLHSECVMKEQARSGTDPRQSAQCPSQGLR